MIAPANFQSYIYLVIRVCFHFIFIVYLHDILMILLDFSQHKNHIWKIFISSSKLLFVAKFSKCLFNVSHISFLSFFLIDKDIEIQTDSIFKILNKFLQKFVCDIQSSLGFTNFRLRFVEETSKTVQILINMIKKLKERTKKY